MSPRVVDISADAVVPEAGDVLAGLGIAPARATARHEAWAARALDVFRDLGRPRGIVVEVTASELTEILEGEGGNAPRTTVGEVVPRSERLALYAATVGRSVGERIAEAFEGGDELLGLFLDSVASRATENASEALSLAVLDAWKEAGAVSAGAAILAYSPGYCGWHLSGQGRLFARLAPEAIGITLGASYLMEPIKSVSGVLVAGRPDIFLDDTVYPFCAACHHPSCKERRQRIRSWS
jgi:hypothetical protein